MITKDTPIMEVLQNIPHSREIFLRHGMHCVSCLGSEFETIEMGANCHDVKLEDLINELNELNGLK